MMTKDAFRQDEKKWERAAYVLKAIAHPQRIQIIQLLREHQQLPVKQIYETLQLEQALISQHLINMRDKGILNNRRRGKHIDYFLADESMGEIIDLLFQSKLLGA